jgi:hypothetical protein
VQPDDLRDAETGGVGGGERRPRLQAPHGFEKPRHLVGAQSITGGRRGVTGDTALRLGAAFGTTPEFWLNLQARWELETARDAAGELGIGRVTTV